MRSFLRTAIFCCLVGLSASGCTVFVRHQPNLRINRFRETPPTTVAVLPFDNRSEEPTAAGGARDALFYALADRGFRMIDLRKIDAQLLDPKIAASLRRPDGQINPPAAGRAFGADAIAVGRVISVKRLGPRPLAWMRIKAQVWLIDTRSENILWEDSVSALVRVFERPRKRRFFAPLEKRQGDDLRICRAFDKLWRKLARKIPNLSPEPEVTQLKISRILIQPKHPVLAAGDRVDIFLRGTPGCVATATLGTLGKTVRLEESRNKTKGLYHGIYTVAPGDRSDYCLVGVTLRSGTAITRRIATARSAFIIDAIAPEPPGEPAYETRPSGVTLTWEPSRSRDVADYLVYRSLSATGAVRLMSRRHETSYTDRTVSGPGRFFYFVKAMDHAGNPSSSSAELVVELPKPGPTTVGGTIEGDVRWTAYGGPYRLAQDIDVAPGARLVIEPGTRIEIPPGMEITVRGTVEAVGRRRQPIRIVGTEASRGFHLAHPQAILRGVYLEISGANRGIEINGGECYLDQVTITDNQVGIEERQSSGLILTHSTLAHNRFGAQLGGTFEVRSSEFVANDVGLRITSDEGTVDQCLFDNLRVDIMKIDGKPLVVDGNTFWTDDPAKLFEHLWGNVVCSSIKVRTWFGRSEKPVQFEPVTSYLARADNAAVDYEWEKALRAYEAALLQDRERTTIDKALKMFKQLVETQGVFALNRELDFCRSATMVYPNDVELLQHLADLYFAQGDARRGREICTRILKIAPNNAYAKKSLAAPSPSP